MFSIRPPFILRVFDRKYLSCSIPTSEKVIYLTFDDGPIPVITPGVLSILEERNIQATFFCVGDNVKKHQDIFAQVSGAGHAIGNHTFHHLNGWKTPPAEYVEDVMRCNEYFQKPVCSGRLTGNSPPASISFCGNISGSSCGRSSAAITTRGSQKNNAC